jgi:hypothetical protein
MEGSCTRTFPRMLLDKPVEIQIGKDTIRVENPTNNLSVGGLHVQRGDLPVGTSVHIRIAARHLFEADGQICYCESRGSGTGIGFTSLSIGSREALDELIEDLTRRGLPAA